MKFFDWNIEKNDRLKKERGICFEDVIIAIEEGLVLEVLEHPNKNKYPNQKMYVVNIENYAYIIPFIDEGEKRFLKTIFPSRKMTAKYIIKEEE